MGLLNCVPCVLKPCSRANVSCVITCWRGNVPCILTCQRDLCAYVLTCQCVLRAHVPMYLACLCVHMPTCLACLSAYLPMCLASLFDHVPTCFACSRAHVPWVLTCLTCQHALRAYVLTCQRGLRVHLLTCQHALSPLLHTALAWLHDHLPACFASSVRSFLLLLFSFTAITAEVVHKVGKVSDFFNYRVRLKRRNIGETLVNYWDLLVSYKLLRQSGVALRMIKNVWRKKTGKMYNVYWLRSYTHTFLFCFFIFTGFNTTPLIHLVKVILIRSCESVQGDWFR